jgi:hypothetical protein
MRTQGRANSASGSGEPSRREQKAALIARRVEVQAVKRQEEAERAERQRTEAARLAAEARAAAAAAARACDVYAEVRASVSRMQMPAPRIERTTVELEQLSRLAPLWDADEGVLARLRQWGAGLSGTRPEDYAPPSAALVLRLKQGYRVLRQQAGDGLVVEESPLLGGFGYRRDEQLVNEDTLTYFNALVALDDAAVLQAFRGSAATGRRLVWEIGGGWGGFAYQFTRVCKDVTYVITAPPELFLVSAVYLSTVVTGASCRFFDPSAPERLWDQWQEADFVFVPDTSLACFSPPKVDLVIDIATLVSMAAGRVREYARLASGLGCRYLFSTMPIDAPADAAARVWNDLEPWYWLHPVPPRGETMPAVPEQGRAAIPPDVRHTHVAGWRRLYA